MAHLQWIPELNTDIEEIDTQHRRIVSYINRLDDLREHPDLNVVKDVIEEMVDYTVSHFAFEEGIMESAGYMFAGPHKRVHDLFTRRVGDFQKRFRAGENVTDDLHSMLSRWLFNHIRNEDHAYVDSVKLFQRASGGTSLHLGNEHKGFFKRLFGG